MAVLFFDRQIASVLLKVSVVGLSVAGLALPVTLMDAPPAGSQATAPSIWKVFKSDVGGFSLLMPGQPLESQSDGVISYSVTRAKESVTYTVSYIDFPTNPTKEANGVTEAFMGIKDGIVEEGGKIQQEQTIALKGSFPGKELRVAMPDGSLTRVRSYIVGKRLYLVMASTNNEKALKQSLQGFLDSFRVKPEQVPEAMPEKAPLRQDFKPQPGASPVSGESMPNVFPKTELSPKSGDN